jgi:hypothetical protein
MHCWGREKLVFINSLHTEIKRLVPVKSIQVPLVALHKSHIAFPLRLVHKIYFSFISYSKAVALAVGE